MNASITLEGMEFAARALKAAGGSPADAKRMNREVVMEVIVPAARREVPVRSGRLKATIDADATPTYGYILAGKKGSVEYGAVIHYGWATRGLGARTSGTVKERRSQLRSALSASATRSLTTRATNKAVRQSSNRSGKGKVRGGPIPPQPFIYDAIDGRHDDVFRAYEEQLEHRFQIEGLL